MLNYTMWSEEDYVLMLLPQIGRCVWLLINNARVCHFSYKLVNLLITNEMLFLACWVRIAHLIKSRHQKAYCILKAGGTGRCCLLEKIKNKK